MKSGEIWTLRDSGYASKARPVVVIQSTELDNFDSVMLCPFTSFDSANIPTRVKIEPTLNNSLQKVCYAMTEKSLPSKMSGAVWWYWGCGWLVLFVSGFVVLPQSY